MRRLTPLLLATAVLAVPSSAKAVTLPGPPVALAAGPGTAYAVVGTGNRNAPFRLTRGSRSLGTFGSRGAEYADVALGPAGPVVVFGRPTSTGFAYDSAGADLGEGTGPPVLTLDGDAPVVAFPDDDGNVVLGGTPLTRSGPLLRHAPLDAVEGPLILDLARSRARTELRVLGAQAPAAPVVSAPGLKAIEATIARDDHRLYVAYRSGNRLTLASAPATPAGRWSRRRLRTRGPLNGVPAVARSGLRTVVATSQRVRGRYSIFLTTAGPAGTFLDRLTRPGGSDLAPLAATGPDGRVHVAWTHRARGASRRTGRLKRVV
jgi:hypothetical protein